MPEKTRKTKTTKATKETPNYPAFTFVEAKLPTLYVNHAQFLASTLDAGLILGEIAGADKNGTLQVIPRLKLAMSHEFMKDLAQLLIRNLVAMENTDKGGDAVNGDETGLT